ncbi:MAG: TolC family protein [Longimicrobiales bacterium]
MTRLRCAGALLALCLLVVPGGAIGQERSDAGWRTSQSDPLAAIVVEALRNNTGLIQERLLAKRSAAEVRRARGRYLPSLTLDGRYTEQDGTLNLGDVVNPANAALNQLLGETRFPTDLDLTLPNRHESRLRLIQPVINEGIRAGISASKRAHESQQQRVRGAMRALAAEAQTAFLNVGAARSVRRIHEATLELVAESERVTQRRVDAGTATPDAVFRARADRSEVAQQLQEAVEREAAAAREFNRIVGRPLDAPVEEVADSLILLDLPVREEEAEARALSGREELREVQAGIGGAEAGVRQASAAFLPAVSVALDYGFQGRDVRFSDAQDFWTASVVVSWNLFSGGQDLARRQAAQADAARLRTRLREAEDLVRLDVRQAYQAAAVARDAIGTAEDRRAAARRTFELVSRRYAEGLASPIEFLDARTALTRAELNRVVTLYRYAIRRVDLVRAAALLDLTAMEKS